MSAMATLTKTDHGPAPLVSVVIPTYNRLERLRHLLEALAAQSYPADRFEVVVVSDGSTDGTDEYLRAEPARPVTFATQPNAGPAAARNLGVELASGALIVFIDDDVVPAPQLVAEHVASHETGEEPLVVIGPMLSPPDHTMSAWIAWEQEMLYKQYAAMIEGRYPATARQFYTGNSSIARAGFLETGGFDTRFRRAEDLELAGRLEDAGYHFAYNHRAAGYHYADRPFASWLRNAHEYGVADAQMMRLPARRSVRAIVRAGFRERNAAVRSVIRVCLGHGSIDRVMKTVLRGTIALGRPTGAQRPTRYALSGLYALTYYGGVGAELGLPAFDELVADRPPEAAVVPTCSPPSAS
jgi:glycosyltransferase involved in cell wall biosynthesis